MKRNLYLMFSLVVLASMVLAACAPQGGEPAVVQVEGLEEQDFAPVKIEAPNCDYGGEFQSIEAVDEFTVKFTLCYPDPAFLSKAAFTSFTIQPKEWLEFTGGTGEILEKPIGTGPYYVEQWERGNQIVMKRFDTYYGEKAKSETLVFRWGTESAQRLLELQSGTVDGIDNVGPTDFETVEGDANLQLVPRQALNIMYFGFNNVFPPFDNEQVRQAIAMGIDRQRIVDNFYPAGSSVATHFTPCAIPNACVGEEWYEFDPVAAKALLAEAGYPDGFDTVINFRDIARSYVALPKEVVQDLQAQLKENLNINAEIEVMESGAFLDAADSGILEGIYLLGWGADYPDQTNFLDYHFGAGSSAQFGEKFEDLTTVLQQAAQVAGDENRKPLYEQANALVKQHVPMVPIAWGGSAIAYKAAVEGGHASPLNDEQFTGVGIPGQDTFVFMQNGEPPSLYCPDETDGEAFRPCGQVLEALYGYEVGGTAVEPDVAEVCEPNEDLTVWTCTLRQGVTFHNGFSLDAADVVKSYGVQWDAADPLHKGNTGAFTYFNALFGAFLNAPPQ